MKHLARTGLLSLALTATAAQTTWYVDASNAAPGSGTQNDPYASLTFALAQPTTASGDTILVAAGAYANERVDFLGKDVAVIGAGRPARS
ncbi:MAG: hypothetical protein GY711_18370 [bacterium]|nr:hypothetical protein [bacterium]